MLFSLLIMFAGQAPHLVSLSSVTGGSFATQCETSKATDENGVLVDLCNSYILGVADALQVRQLTCRPNSDAATLQTVTIVRRAIHDHPERWGQPPVFQVQDALKAAFPCNKNSK